MNILAKRQFNFVKNMFEGKRADVDVILNIWKRPYLREQLEALSRQTIKPSQIWILHSDNHRKEPTMLKNYGNIHYIHSSFNLKYFWRFSMIHHFQNKYTWVLDDDMIPGKYWIEKCLDTCEKYNSIVVSNGRIIQHNNFFPEITTEESYWHKHFIGDSKHAEKHNFCDKDTFVDYGCSSYFFKTAWLNHFWSLQPLTLDTGEDMHLSATCKIKENIPTIVPCQTSIEESGNTRPIYGSDSNASWKQQEFYDKRAQVLKYLIEDNQWEPLLWRKEAMVAAGR